MNLKILIGAAFMALSVPAPAISATLIVNIDGQLTGATGVDVGGMNYDVEFVDGTCTDVFDGCDDISDFDFQTADDALLAANALLDQVLLDGPDGLFDSSPELTFGLNEFAYFSGNILIPYEFHLPDLLFVAHASNFSPEEGDFALDEFPFPTWLDTSNDGRNVYSRWTLGASFCNDRDVPPTTGGLPPGCTPPGNPEIIVNPLPPSLALFLGGLGALGFMARRRRLG